MKILLAALCIAFQQYAAEAGSCSNAAAQCTNLQQAGNSGSFSSPNYPNNYCANLNCTYYITGISGYIQITFIYYDTEQGTDFIYVYDGPKTDDSASLLAKFSGTYNKANQIFYSGGNTMSVKFSTDAGVQNKGWRLTWKTVPGNCGAQSSFTAPSGTISSTNWPNDYPNNLDCTYRIRVTSGSVIQLKFSNASYVEPGDDKVIISDQNGNILQDDTGGNFPPFTSVNNFLSIRITSDIDVIYPGFSLTYTTVAPTNNCQCGPATRYITSPSGYQQISSPNWPRAYCENHNCTWYLNVPENFNVGFSCQNFTTESGFDTLYVHNGLGVQTPLLESCTGGQCTSMTSSSNWLSLQFITDGSVAGGGWACKFRPVNGAGKK